jgi:hypothetical protein
LCGFGPFGHFSPFSLFTVPAMRLLWANRYVVFSSMSAAGMMVRQRAFAVFFSHG